MQYAGLSRIEATGRAASAHEIRHSIAFITPPSWPSAAAWNSCAAFEARRIGRKARKAWWPRSS
jgi:hypothetical protein